MERAQDVLDSGHLPNDHEDARLIRWYQGRGGDVNALIYLSLGETWQAVAPGLAATLATTLPGYAHGYTLSPYGLPALREALLRYIVRTHHLPPPDATSFDVCVSQSGTRAAMSDFGHLLLDLADTPGGSPTALIPVPGWDYAGVLAPLGYRLLPYGLRREHGWQPDVAEVRTLLHLAGPGGLLVLNPQHNPTGVECAADTVAALVEASVGHQAAVLLDDAYYALHAPDRSPTNALHVLLQATQGTSVPWLATRTLGKQFHCNGWGIGALTGRPAVLAGMARIMQRRSYGTALPLQAAMATWLGTPEPDAFTHRLRHTYARARRDVTRWLRDTLGFPAHAVHPGSCSAYLRFQIPERFVRDGSEDHYRRLCLTAGVLPDAGSMTRALRLPHEPEEVYVRLFLGQPGPVLNEAVNRMARAGLTW
ncbi:aminotransferase class I/II-fold pyridoxal phosphate-dependent enzyme [Streptomyces longwoodensis]|uniref:aminotransferase class I/II-fold pyridoxal phosphate-dependent enzyme n=1 Tax=Streptomyces longwoodensis TaxID=68231 RepID=UPI0033D4ADCF